MPWNEVASYISALDTANRFTKETIAINNSGYNSWMANGDISPSNSYTVLCVTFPEWTINGRNTVSWSGPFVFFEARV